MLVKLHYRVVLSAMFQTERASKAERKENSGSNSNEKLSLKVKTFLELTQHNHDEVTKLKGWKRHSHRYLSVQELKLVFK